MVAPGRADETPAVCSRANAECRARLAAKRKGEPRALEISKRTPSAAAFAVFDSSIVCAQAVTRTASQFVRSQRLRRGTALAAHRSSQRPRFSVSIRISQHSARRAGNEPRAGRKVSEQAEDA